MDTSTLMFLFVLGGGAVINLFLLSVTTWMVLARIGEVEQELAEQKVSPPRANPGPGVPRATDGGPARPAGRHAGRHGHGAAAG